MMQNEGEMESRGKEETDIEGTVAEDEDACLAEIEMSEPWLVRIGLSRMAVIRGVAGYWSRRTRVVNLLKLKRAWASRVMSGVW